MRLERDLQETVDAVAEAIGLDFTNPRADLPNKSVRFDLETPEGFKVAEVVLSRHDPRGPWKVGGLGYHLFDNLTEVFKAATAP